MGLFGKIVLFGSVLYKGNYVWFVKVIATFYLTLDFHTDEKKSELSDIKT